MTDDPPIDDFHRHEVLHMASVIADMFETYVEQHRFTQSDSDLLAAAAEIGDRLRGFYQEVGAKTL